MGGLASACAIVCGQSGGEACLWFCRSVSRILRMRAHALDPQRRLSGAQGLVIELATALASEPASVDGLERDGGRGGALAGLRVRARGA